MTHCRFDQPRQAPFLRGRRPRFRPRSLLLIPLFLSILAGSAACDRQAVPSPTLLQSHPAESIERLRPVEFAVPEAQGPVLAEIRSTDANLETQVLSFDGQLLSRVRFDYLRSVPMYHLIETAQGPSSPRLRITPWQAPTRATVSVRFFELPPEEDGGATLVDAWRNLARGQRRIDTFHEEAWNANLAALAAAQTGFEQLGLRTPALWSGFLRAYLLYFPLYRYPEAADLAHALIDWLDGQDDPERLSGERSVLRVLAHQLAGQILLESQAADDDAPDSTPLEAARIHFETARELAALGDLGFEETWAINNLGIAWFYEDQLGRALARYSEALRRAEAAEDSYLVGLIGANVAVAQERSGQIEAAVHTLERIAQEATMRDSPLEREHLLSLLGTYYIKMYRFSEALETLNEALRLSDELDSSENRGRNRVMLGRAYRELGQPGKALTVVEPALTDLAAVGDARGLRQARRLIADLHRTLGDFDSMNRERQRQRQALPPDTDLDRADWSFSRAEDALARGEAASASALFFDSADFYDAAGLTTQADMARLHACAADDSLSLAADRCAVDRLRPVYDQVQDLQASSQAMGARFAWIRLLVAQDHREEALGESRRLIEDIHFYRQELPGVLGAWYWDAREVVLSSHLRLLLDASAGTARGRPDVLLALDQLRNADFRVVESRQSEPDLAESARSEAGSARELGSLLAQRDRAGTPEEQLAVQRLIDRELARRHSPALSRSPAERVDLLQAFSQLPPDWSVLVYYLAEPRSLAWVADDSGLQLIELGPAEPILERIDRVKSVLRVYNDPSLEAELAGLSRQLIGPVQAKLRFNVALATGGALSDLPLDILPLDGQAFIERHQLLHIQSVRWAARSARRTAETLAPGRLFLAGNPDLAGDSLNAVPGTRQELEALRTAFPDIEAAVFTGPSLTAAAFGSEAFKSADLVHLASHALIDRDYPELSRLVLSGGNDDSPAFLTPADLQGIPLAARLVVLSACETVGVNRFDFDNRLGFVTGLLKQSDALVVASLWPVSDRVTRQLMADFYTELAARGQVAAALRAAKLKQRTAATRDDRAWAAFQLFSR